MEKKEKFKRALYREFLFERGLYRDAGLDKLPERLAALLKCPNDQAISKALEGPFLDAIEDFERLEELLQVRDMVLLSRTPAEIAADLKAPSTSYDACIRLALCYAVAGRQPQAFAALRAAAAKNDSWARHHYIYGLLHASAADAERACFELDMALEREPYDDGRIRISRLLDLIDCQ